MSNAYWNILNDGDRLANSHALVIGGSGSGKTFLVRNVLIPQMLGNRARVMILDYNGDYEDADFLDGLCKEQIQHVRPDVESLGFNPFVIAPTGNSQKRATHVIELTSLFTKVFKLGEQQKAALRDVIDQEFIELGVPKEFGDDDLSHITIWPNFASIVEGLSKKNLLAANRMRDLAMLEVFSSDGESFGELLEGSCVVSLKDLPGDYSKEAVADLLMRAVYSKLLRDGMKSRTDFFIIVDEAHKIANLPGSATLLREARKYGTGVVLSSQRPGDFSETVLANVATKFLFRVNLRADAAICAKELLKAPALTDEIMDLKVGECIMSNQHITNRRVKVSADPMTITPDS
jgi:type IV secretory pathway VirB4 component